MRFWLAAIFLFAVLIASVVYVRTGPVSPSAGTAAKEAARGCRMVDQDFARRSSEVWVTLDATVERLLPDASGRYRHQRFIVRCQDGHTVLIVNDVSIGRRVPVLVGGAVGVRGQYVWNPEGGLVHFTHHSDTGGQAGWILWHGHVYS